MIFATKQQTTADNFTVNLSSFSHRTDISPLLLTAMQTTFANMKTGYDTTQVFTDDRAPIEWIVDDMVVRFTLSGGLSGLQQYKQMSLRANKASMAIAHLRLMLMNKTLHCSFLANYTSHSIYSDWLGHTGFAHTALPQY